MTVPPRPFPISFDYQVRYCDTGIAFTSRPESIEWIKEDQPFLRSYDSAPRPPPPSPLSRLSELSLFLTLPACVSSGQAYRGGGGWAVIYDSEKALPSTNNSILSVLDCPLRGSDRSGSTPHGTDLSGQIPYLAMWMDPILHFPLKMICICNFLGMFWRSL